MAKRVLSLLLALVMALSLCVPAFAAEPTDTAAVEEIDAGEPAAEAEEVIAEDVEAAEEPADEPAAAAEEEIADEPAPILIDVTDENIKALQDIVAEAKELKKQVDAGELRSSLVTNAEEHNFYPNTHVYGDDWPGKEGKPFYEELERAETMLAQITDAATYEGIISDANVEAQVDALQDDIDALTNKPIDKEWLNNTRIWQYLCFFGSASTALTSSDWNTLANSGSDEAAKLALLVADLKKADGTSAGFLQPEYIARVLAAVEKAQAVYKAAGSTHKEYTDAMDALYELRVGAKAYTAATLADKDDAAALQAAIDAYKAAKKEAEKQYVLSTASISASPQKGILECENALTPAEAALAKPGMNGFTTDTQTLKAVLTWIKNLNVKYVEAAKEPHAAHVYTAVGNLRKGEPGLDSGAFDYVNVTLRGKASDVYDYVVTWSSNKGDAEAILKFGGSAVIGKGTLNDTGKTSKVQRNDHPDSNPTQYYFRSGTVITVKVYGGVAKTAATGNEKAPADFLNRCMLVDTFQITLDVTNDTPVVVESGYYQAVDSKPASFGEGNNDEADAIYVRVNKAAGTGDGWQRFRATAISPDASAAPVSREGKAVDMSRFLFNWTGTGKVSGTDLVPGAWKIKLALFDGTTWVDIKHDVTVIVPDITGYKGAAPTSVPTSYSSTCWGTGYPQLLAAIEKAETYTELQPVNSDSERKIVRALNVARALVEKADELAYSNVDSNGNTKAVDDAINGLAKAFIDGYATEADTTALEAAIAAAKALKEEDYTHESWLKADIPGAIKAAEAVLAKHLPKSKEQDIQDAVDALNGQIAKLEAIKVTDEDVNKLEAAIEAAQAALDAAGEDYTEESKAALRGAIWTAEALAKADRDEITISELNDTIAALEAAVEGLEKVVDTEALEGAIKAAETAIADPSKYTAASVKDVEDAVAAAKEVLANKDATQAEVDAAAKAVNDAVAALVSQADADLAAAKEALKAAIAAAEAKVAAGNYTDASTKAVTDAIAKANALPETATAAEINAAAKAVNDAAAALVAIEPATGKGWTKGNDGKSWFYFVDGKAVKSKWVKSEKGLWYYLDENGVMATGVTYVPAAAPVGSTKNEPAGYYYFAPSTAKGGGGWLEGGWHKDAEYGDVWSVKEHNGKFGMITWTTLTGDIK